MIAFLAGVVFGILLYCSYSTGWWVAGRLEEKGRREAWLEAYGRHLKGGA